MEGAWAHKIAIVYCYNMAAKNFNGLPAPFHFILLLLTLHGVTYCEGLGHLLFKDTCEK